ncbi:nitrate- and nitrite sensing domain-containing protein [Streptomyces sp. NPDC012508]|uniref:sensor histidine kinase n=1 Tax=Streptomyces sp. NPDC012508 TaxID=3364837 RepID=UPI0036AD3CE0
MSAPLVPRSIRAKTVCLLMVPAVSLMALWAFATVTTARNVSELNSFKEANTTLLRPVDAVVAAVQAERAGALRQFAGASGDRAESQGGRERDTDTAATALRRGAEESTLDVQHIGGEFAGRIDRLVADLDGLGALREQARRADGEWRDVYDAYGSVIDHALALQGSLAALHDPEHASAARVVHELAWAREMLAREDALMGAAQTSGRLDPAQYREFVGSAHTQRRLLSTAVDDLRPVDAAAYRTVLAGAEMRSLRIVEDKLLSAGSATAARTVTETAHWQEPAQAVLLQLGTAQTEASTAAAESADPLSFAVLGGSGIAVALGLVGVLLSLLISVRIGRGLVDELTDLRDSALTLADRELPETIRRLHAGDTVDLDAVAPLRDHRDDEIGQVGAALAAVHRAAVESAAERAQVLHGISGVYVNLARRSQALLHRQLTLLDTMERRNEDPVELEDLFRLDHLTTRMRRHAESLIILSGATPGRGWRRPVGLMDVVRAAVAEVEDFGRVEVHGIPGVRLHGAAVADLTHLLAELVENATSFSPPQTKVEVRGQRVGSGVVLEIEDRGLGMSAEGFAEANSRIEDTGRIDLLDSGQLGLFVVNRLAHRLDVRVGLRPSVYGGVVAVVLLPTALLSEDAREEGQDKPGTATGNGLPRRRPPGRHAARPRVVRDALPTAERAAPPAPPAPSHREAPPYPAAPPEQAAPAEPVAPAEHMTPPHPVAPPPPVAPPAYAAPVANGAPGVPAAPGDKAPLPRRARRRDLEGDDVGESYEPPTEHGPRRSPEQARATMASFRAGWARGTVDRPTRPGPAGEEKPEREGESR